MRLRLVSFNIHHGEGAGGENTLRAQAELLRDLNADVVFLQEVDSCTRRSGGIDQTSFLARDSAFRYHVFGKNMDMDGGDYGNAILSRFELTWGAHYVIPAHEPHLPRLFEKTGALYPLEPRGILRAEARIDGTKYTLLSAHFGFLQSELREGVDAVVSLARRVNGPVLMGSDMNTMDQNAPELARLREVVVDCAAALHQESIATFPADNPMERLDYILVRGPFRTLECQVVATRTSDHRPIVVDIESQELEVPAVQMNSALSSSSTQAR